MRRLAYIRKIFVYLIIFSFININFSYGKIQQNPLIEAVLNSDMYQVAKFANQKNVDLKDVNGNTALFYAIQNEDYDIIKLLLNNGARPENVDGKGFYTYCSGQNSQDYRIRKLFANYNNNQCNNKVAKKLKIKKISTAKSTNKNLEGGFSNLFNWKTLTAGAVIAGGAVALASGGGGGGGGGDGTSSSSNDYDTVGEVDETTLNNILNGTNTADADYYSGYTYSANFTDGTNTYTFSNYDDYNEIRLAYAWARGYTGKISSSSYLSSSSGTPYYLTSASGTTTYNVGDSIKVAVVDQGVFSTNDYIENNLDSSTSSTDSNQLYQYYLNNCVSNSCIVYASDDYGNYTAKYLK